MSPIRAVAWDIDGTLIDSEPLHDAVLVEVCASYGASLADIPTDRFRGVHMPDVWGALKPRLPAGLEQREWCGAIIDRYIERAGELQPLLDAVEAMRALANAGIRQACVSNSGRRVVDANLAALGISDLIDFSISLDDVSAGKPEPEPYLLAARRLGMPAAEIVAVEDSVAGATSALAAGLKVFAIAPADGGHIGPAHRTISRLRDLPGLILSPQCVGAR